MNEKEYFNPEKSFNYKSIQLPKELFFNDLYKDMSLESKVIYSIIRDRAYLSQKNNWIKDEHLYLIVTRQEIQRMLNLSNKTVIKAFRELNEKDLILEKRQGNHKPNLIFPLELKHDKSLDFLICKNYTSRSEKNTSLEVKNLHTNYTNNNYTNITKRKRINYLEYEQRNYTNEDFEKMYENKKWFV